ncbi:hypothetical protein VTK26DRAFT_9182 [Humicola hyalothermophila]
MAGSVTTRASSAAVAAAATAAASSGAAPGAVGGGVDVVMGGTTSTSTFTTTTTTTTTTVVSASLLATAVSHSPGSGPGGMGMSNAIDKGVGGLEPRARCSQCGRRRAACNHQPPRTPSANPINANGAPSAVPPPPLHARPRRISKLKHRALTGTFAAQVTTASTDAAPPAFSSSSNYSLSSSSSSSSANGNIAAARSNSDIAITTTTTTNTQSSNSSSDKGAMEPPVLSFYGKEPVPLPSRFAQIKRALAAGNEAAIEASWARLLHALRDHVEDIAHRGSSITPSIDFADMHDPEAKAAFSRELKRYGLGLIRGVMPRDDAQAAIDETVKYLEKQTDFKEPPPQDPTCFDFFWTPAQVRTRAHPRVLEAQRFAMSLWDHNADDRMAIRFPIAYADRLRIHGANIGGVGPDAPPRPKDDVDEETVAQKAAAELELLGDFTSSTVIAQVDNGSLERWEPDGYGRGGTYDAVFKGQWENYDPWDPTHRVSATSDLYNGHGACSIFRMYQGMVALSTIEPGLIRLLPSPKLATAYFLLRPFFSPKTKPPERRDGPEWEAFLDPSNWSLDREQSTIIHGAVPGHAQRLTELWHPHLHLRRTLVTIPTLHTGDYIVWHPDLAYHITSSNPNLMASRAPTPPPSSSASNDPGPSRPVSILVYVPAVPLTQNSALYLARQRKTFQRGHPGPDFDSTGSGLGSEASHVGRPTETDIAEVGGPAGLQAMGLAPFDVAPTPPVVDEGKGSGGEGGGEGEGEGERKERAEGEARIAGGDVDVSMEDGTATARGASASADAKAGAGGVGGMTRAEAEVARLANIILFPDRYDFYMAKRNANGSKRSKVLRSGTRLEDGSGTKGKEKEKEQAGDGKREGERERERRKGEEEEEEEGEEEEEKMEVDSEPVHKQAGKGKEEEKEKEEKKHGTGRSSSSS